MSTFKSFQEMELWKEAKVLTTAIYMELRSSKDFGFKDQIQRASISIMNNIAEGSNRQTNREFIKFLYYARGSTNELKSMLLIANDLDEISESKMKDLTRQAERISAGLYKLIKYLEKHQHPNQNR